MKAVFFGFISSLAIGFASAPQAQAQEEHRLGIHFDWWRPYWERNTNTLSDSVAFGADYIYSMEVFDIRPSLTYFFQFAKPSNLSVNAFEIQVDFLWRFIDYNPRHHGRRIHPYFGLGLGVDIFMNNVSNQTINPSVGPNFIAGVDFSLKHGIHLFVELDYRLRFDNDIKVGSATASTTNTSGPGLMFGINFET